MNWVNEIKERVRQEVDEIRQPPSASGVTCAGKLIAIGE